MHVVPIPAARVFQPLRQPTRYKGAWGGRGSGKSHFFGELLVERCLTKRGTLAVCIRETQKTLAQSSKRLVEDKIAALGVGSQFRILADKIETPGGGLIIFNGMQDHNAESIKSLEGYKIAWIEEAQTLSARSLSLLRPTIRTDGSEIWASWNPRQKKDAIDAFLRLNKPDNAIVVQATGAITRGGMTFLSKSACSTSTAMPTAISMCGRVTTLEPMRALTSAKGWQPLGLRVVSAKSPLIPSCP